MWTAWIIRDRKWGRGNTQGLIILKMDLVDFLLQWNTLYEYNIMENSKHKMNKINWKHWSDKLLQLNPISLSFDPLPPQPSLLKDLLKQRLCQMSSSLLHIPQFSSVQFSHSVVSDSSRLHEYQHTRPPCPSQTPGVHSGSRPSSRWCHPAISSSVIPFSSCPQSLPASESFPMSQLFTWGGQSSGVSALASFLPKNTHISLSSLWSFLWGYSQCYIIYKITHFHIL